MIHLDVDADGAKYLGFAKSKLALQKQFMAIFTKVFPLPDATITISSDGVSDHIRIKGGTMPYWYPVQLDLPCAGRVLTVLDCKPVVTQLVTLNPVSNETVTDTGVVNFPRIITFHTVGSSTQVLRVGTIDVVSYNFTIDSLEVATAQLGGGIDFVTTTVVHNMVVSASSDIFGTPLIFLPHEPGFDWYLVNGTYIFHNGSNFSGIVITGIDFNALLTAAIGYNGHPNTKVILDDGQVLLVSEYSNDRAGHEVNFPLDNTNFPNLVDWPGGNWLQTFNQTAPNVFTIGDRLTFTVPADVTYPASAETPPATPVTVPNWEQDWAEARKTAKVRERVRRKACTDSLFTQMRTSLPESIHAVLRTGHPVSSGTKMSALMAVSVFDDVIGSGDDITYSKSVTLTYTSPSGTFSGTINGTKRVRITRINQDSIGNPVSLTARTTTYTSWLPIDTTGAVSEAGADYRFRKDDGLPLCQIIDGVLVEGGTGAAGVLDTHGQPYRPPYAESMDQRTISYPQIYRDYRAAIKRQYDIATAARDWLDSMFIDQELIDVFPISTIHADLGDLGMFPQDRDLQAVDKLSMTCRMRATYQYSYLDGNWILVFSVAFDGGAKPSGLHRPAAPVLPYTPGLNMVFRSRVSPTKEWKSVSVTYRAQASIIRQNPGSGNNPIFLALAALGA